jgi:hypothetical protein
LNNTISRIYPSKPAYWGDIYDVDINPNGKYPNPNWEDISLDPSSNFWRVSSFRMGVRNFDISYSVPRKVVETLRMSSARIYLTGLNPINLYNPFDYKDP